MHAEIVFLYMMFQFLTLRYKGFFLWKRINMTKKWVPTNNWAHGKNHCVVSDWPLTGVLVHCFKLFQSIVDRKGESYFLRLKAWLHHVLLLSSNTNLVKKLLSTTVCKAAVELTSLLLWIESLNILDTGSRSILDLAQSTFWAYFLGQLLRRYLLMFYSILKKTLVIILESRVEWRVGFALVTGREAVLQEIRKVHRNCDTSSWFHENWKGYHHRSIHVTRKGKQRKESLYRYASRDHDVRKIPEQWCALRFCGSKALQEKSFKV